jgi:hypothetical protein
VKVATKSVGPPISYTYNTASKINVLSYPYILVRIPELDTNNYGTDNNIDNSFAVLQYDANWYTDTTNLSDGYLGMIPKFMKCQKVYQPTPLATLTKLTIELQQPNGSSLSDIPDTLSIKGIYGSQTVAIAYDGIYKGATFTGGSVYYIIETTEYFSQWMFQPGNRIQIKGIDQTQISAGATPLATDQFQNYIQQDNGHLIVAIARNIATAAGVDPDKPNSIGYANLIIVEAPFVYPTSATPAVQPFGGSSTANSDLATALSTTTFTGAKLINLTHQTNVVLRIITRDMDPAARVRPDNL